MKYKVLKIFLLLVLTCIICSCAVDDYQDFDSNTELKENSVPVDWKCVEASNVEFYIPFNLAEKQPRKPMLKGSSARLG